MKNGGTDCNVPHVVEYTAIDTLYCSFEVGSLEDNAGRLPPQFESGLLQVRVCGGALNTPSDKRAPSKRDFVHVRVICQGSAGISSISWDDIHDPWWDAGLLNQSTKIQC